MKWSPQALAVSAPLGLGVCHGPPGQPANIRFVIDFAGPAVEALTAREQIDAEVHYGEGARFVADTVTKNQLNGSWRLVIEITAPTKAFDLNAVLKRRGGTHYGNLDVYLAAMTRFYPQTGTIEEWNAGVLPVGGLFPCPTGDE